MKKTISFILILFIACQLPAQLKIDYPVLQRAVDTSEIIFEGRDIKDDGVTGADGKIFTVHYFLTLKWFKGPQRDTVKIITAGGKVLDKVTLASDPAAPVFGAGFEYLLFCKKEDVRPFQPVTGVYFYPVKGTYGNILLGKAFDMKNTREHFFYDHLYKQNYPVNLFGPLAKITGKNYQVIRADVTDRVIEFKESERKKFVADSLQKINGTAH